MERPPEKCVNQLSKYSVTENMFTGERGVIFSAMVQILDAFLFEMVVPSDSPQLGSCRHSHCVPVTESEQLKHGRQEIC